MKIVITNAYTWHNKGDAGILLGTIEALKQTYDKVDLSIDILSFTPKEDAKHYLKDPCVKHVYSNILNPHPYRHTKLGKIWAAFKLALRATHLYFLTKINLAKAIKREPALATLKSSDAILVCGGGFLGGKKYDSLMHVFQIYIDTLFQKPVLMMGTSVEPMQSNFIKRKTEKTLKKLDHIYAREQITYDYLKTFMPQYKISLTPDLAFMVNTTKYHPAVINTLQSKQQKLIGLTVRNWHTDMQKYLSSIAKVIDSFYENHHTSFIFVPQVIVSHGNDINVAKALAGQLQHPEALTIIEDDLTPMQIKGLISNFNYFVGTRMHSNIFATSVNTPTTAIAYEQKTNGIMQMLDLKNFIIDINHISAENLSQKISHMSKDHSVISAKLAEKIPTLKNQILDNFKLLQLLAPPPMAPPARQDKS